MLERRKKSPVPAYLRMIRPNQVDIHRAVPAKFPPAIILRHGCILKVKSHHSPSKLPCTVSFWTHIPFEWMLILPGIFFTKTFNKWKLFLECILPIIMKVNCSHRQYYVLYSRIKAYGWTFCSWALDRNGETTWVWYIILYAAYKPGITINNDDSQHS